MLVPPLSYKFSLNRQLSVDVHLPSTQQDLAADRWVLSGSQAMPTKL